jgi:hypothetical protein
MELPHFEILNIFHIFSPVFSSPCWKKAVSIFVGTVLCKHKHTTTNILRALGLSQSSTFCNFHRFFNRDKWSMTEAAKILAQKIISVFIPEGPILIGIDETLERRWGKKIKMKAPYRDPLRSSKKGNGNVMGIKWISLMFLVKVPWGIRRWALPFFTVLAPHRKHSQNISKKHKTVIMWAIQMMKWIVRFVSKSRKIIFVGDGAYGGIRFAWECSKLGVSLVARSRFDLSLYGHPPRKKQRGRKRVKGKKLPKLREKLKTPKKQWKSSKLSWYGGETRRVKYLTGVAIWYSTALSVPLKIRWVIVQEPGAAERCLPLICNDISMKPHKIIEYYVARWSLEVTFEESRAHLGIETQRQWSDRSIERQTPFFLSTFSLICLVGHKMFTKGQLVVQKTAWYKKQEITFSDIVHCLRRELLLKFFFDDSYFKEESSKKHVQKALSEALNFIEMVA